MFRSKTKAMAEMMCAWRTRGRSLQKNRSNCRPVRCCRGDGTVRARAGGALWGPSAPRAYLPLPRPASTSGPNYTPINRVCCALWRAEGQPWPWPTLFGNGTSSLAGVPAHSRLRDLARACVGLGQRKWAQEPAALGEFADGAATGQCVVAQVQIAWALPTSSRDSLPSLKKPV